MSQHVFNTRYQGKPITVMMGWDRPLQGFFMVIEEIDRDEEHCIYSNLDDPTLGSLTGLAPTIQPFINKLNELSISVPKEMLDGVTLDGVYNVGNKTAHYCIAGAQS